MRRIIIVYGAIAGFITITTIIIGLSDPIAKIVGDQQMILGYLIMLVALSAIFVGTKKVRDQEFGGAISFGKAALTGLGISVMAGVVYVFVWEIYLAMTDYAFIDDYTESVISNRQASGANAAALQATIAEMEVMKEQYQNPLFRLPMTFLEIFPVGIFVSLLSAGILRNSKILPTRASAK